MSVGFCHSNSHCKNWTESVVERSRLDDFLARLHVYPVTTTGMSTGKATLKVASPQVAEELARGQHRKVLLRNCTFTATVSTAATSKRVVYLYPKKKHSDHVRAAGGKYDNVSKKFYVEKSLFQKTPESFAKWIPDHADANAVKFERLSPVSSVTITGLDPRIDENGLIKLLAPYKNHILSANIERTAPRDIDDGGDAEDVDMFMTRIQSLLAVGVPSGTDYTAMSSAVDTHQRSSMMVRLPTHQDAIRTAERMNRRDVLQLGKLNGQKVRANAKIFFSFTCDCHVYRVLKRSLTEILASAGNAGVGVRITVDDTEYRVELSGELLCVVCPWAMCIVPYLFFLWKSRHHRCNLVI